MTTEQKTNAGTRLGSMILDHIAMTFVAMLFAIPGILMGLSTAFEVTHEQSSPDIFGGMSYIGMIGIALYFCKDSFNGRSIAKRALKLQVVENTNGKVASSLRCFVRNIFCILWPIEVIVTLFSPSRRIGDLVAGTKVVPYNPSLEQPKIKYGQIGLSIILAYGLMMIIMLPFEWLQSSIQSNNQTMYVESTFNEEAANETEQLYLDNLNEYLTSDVIVYDQLQQNHDLKYVSVIFNLKENYLKDDEEFEQISIATEQLLLTKFPEGTFVGQLKYIYQRPGNMQTTTVQLDWREIE